MPVFTIDHCNSFEFIRKFEIFEFIRKYFKLLFCRIKRVARGFKFGANCLWIGVEVDWIFKFYGQAATLSFRRLLVESIGFRLAPHSAIYFNGEVN